MNIIKFSKIYPKLWKQKYARLIKVYILDQNDLNDSLILYDTVSEDGSKYELPNTKLIQLIFYGERRIPFCTIRRYTQEKYEYYKSKVEQEFEVEIINSKGESKNE